MDKVGSLCCLFVPELSGLNYVHEFTLKCVVLWRNETRNYCDKLICISFSDVTASSGLL